MKQHNLDFAERLKQRLADLQMKESPTHLARAFNKVSETQVTVHAVRKWLIGESTPTQDKLVVLSTILCTEPHWLRFGSGVKRYPTTTPALDVDKLQLLTHYINLSPKARKALLLVAETLVENQ